MDFVKTFGFTSVDNAALLKLNTIVEVVVFNMLNNVLFVTEALQVKTIKKGHFLGVFKILKEAASRCEKNQKGGTVLPAEYFGHDSGRYFDTVDFHDTSFIDGLTRGPLFVQEAGASKSVPVAITVDEIKAIIAKYKKETDAEFIVAKDVYAVIQQCVLHNMTQLLSAASDKGKNKTLTATLINKSIKNAGAELKHLKHVWSKA